MVEGGEKNVPTAAPSSILLYEDRDPAWFSFLWFSLFKIAGWEDFCSERNSVGNFSIGLFIETGVIEKEWFILQFM